MEDIQDTSPNNMKAKTSPTVGKIALALSKAQGAFDPLVKNCIGKVTYTGGSYEFHYADLGAVFDATREALAANELATTAFAVADADGGTLRVCLIHSSGEWLASDGFLPSMADVGPQKYGSAMTYSKRYLSSSLLGVASEDDDDANAAQPGTSAFTKQQKPAQPKPAAKPADPAKEEHAAKTVALGEALKAAGRPTAEWKPWMAKVLGKPVPNSDALDMIDLAKLTKALAEEVAHGDKT